MTQPRRERARRHPAFEFDGHLPAADQTRADRLPLTPAFPVGGNRIGTVVTNADVSQQVMFPVRHRRFENRPGFSAETSNPGNTRGDFLCLFQVIGLEIIIVIDEDKKGRRGGSNSCQSGVRQTLPVFPNETNRQIAAFRERCQVQRRIRAVVDKYKALAEAG